MLKDAPLVVIFAITWSGLTISISFFNSISEALTSPISFFDNVNVAVAFPFILKDTSFKFNIISITSSWIPSIVLYSCWTPSIETSVTDDPTIDESIILLKALPKVCPKPLSRGSRVTLVLFNDTFSILTILGFNKLLKFDTI